MRNKIATIVCVLLALPICSHAASINKFLSSGAETFVFQEKDAGCCVGALGFSDKTGKNSKDIEIARTKALEALGGFIAGRTISSRSATHFETMNDQVKESFMNEMHSNMKAYLRAVEYPYSGIFQDQRYVFAQVCQKRVSVASSLKASLQDNTVRATGVASLGMGKEKARKLALEDALRNAVAQYSGIDTVSQTTVTDHESLNSKMTSRSKGTVSKYKIVNETIEGGLVRIDVVATIEDKPVDPSRISQVVRENQGRPSIYIDTTDKLASKEMERLLKANSYDVTRNKKVARYIMKIDVYVVEQETLADMIGRQTTLNISLQDKMSSDDAIVIQNDPTRSTEASDNPHLRATRSMKYAVEDISKELLEHLNEHVVDQFNNGTKVLISFRNFERLGEVEAMANLLRSLPQMKMVTPRPVQGNVAYYEVLYLGEPSEIQLLVPKNAYKFRLNGLRGSNQKGDGLEFTF